MSPPSRQGNTEESAIENIREAIELYLEPVDDDWLIKEGDIIQELSL
jgi:predicted RNase H-like HicB family nuclease